ncbi:MAG TPA: hypothetical protein DEG43_12785 [Acidimicrobiaceae bacterium]|jgi:hypothetical protein|nr:hypothetical protein [Acidimicrobiaceae bacterium]
MVAQLMAFESPGAAAKAVSAAWEAGDLQAAQLAGLAPPAELEKLFGAPPVVALKDRGCDDGIDGAANCFIANGDGGVNISLRAGERGWEIEFLDAY